MKKGIIISLLVIVPVIIMLCSDDNDNKVAFQKEPGEESGSNWPPSLGGLKVELQAAGQKNYYIIFDGSGSMYGRKLKVAKKALKKFIKLIPEDANIGLTAFDNNSNSERAAIGSKKELILTKVDRIVAGGSTPLGQSVELAYMKLGLQANRQLGYGDYNLVIITDGQATDEWKLKDAIKYILAESPVIIHTIGFQIGTGHPLNQPGKIYYKTAQNFEELSKGLESVLAELEDFTVTDFKK